MEKYDPLGVVGEGSYGIVLKCKTRDTGRTVAIKKFIDSEDDPNVRKIALREIRVLRKLRHENLVNLIEVFRRRKHLYLVFEFIDHTLLDQLEQKSHGFDEITVRKYIFQIVRGLGFCHDNNIIHRDIKPENILVSKNDIIKLCDFGFARNLCGPGDVYTDYVATRWYRAPELLVGDIYGKEVDIWAVGTLFSEMSTGEPLFPGDSDIDQLFLISQCLGRLSKRHLSIMAKNSAFKGFKYPKSRHGSTTSNGSSKFIGGNITPSFVKTTGGTGSKQNSGRIMQKIPGVEESVFSQMFPSWTDEAVQFLTMCLDPEPSQRPTCNGILRLPYFTHDNFPTKFIAELNQKLSLEGKPPVTAFSTRKKRSILGANVNPVNPSNNTNTNLITPNTGQKPFIHNTYNYTLNQPNKSEENQPPLPLSQQQQQHQQQQQQANGNVLQQKDTLQHQQQTTISGKIQFQSNNLQNMNNFNATRQKTFLVEKALKDKLASSSILQQQNSQNSQNHQQQQQQQQQQQKDSKIPVFLRDTVKKPSDDLIIFTSSSSDKNVENGKINKTKSSPNLVTTYNQSNYTNSSSHNNHSSTTDFTLLDSNVNGKRFSMPTQQKVEPKKYSFSYPNEGEAESKILNTGFTHPPVTTLSFNLGQNGQNAGPTSSIIFQQTPTTPGQMTNHNNNNSKMSGKKSSPGPQRKRTVGSTNLFLHNSYTSNLIQPQNPMNNPNIYSITPNSNVGNISNNGTTNTTSISSSSTFNPQTFFANPLSNNSGSGKLPVSIFGSSLLNNSNSSPSVKLNNSNNLNNGALGLGVIREQNSNLQYNNLPQRSNTKSPWSSGGNNLIEESLPFLTLGSPSNNGLSSKTSINRKPVVTFSNNLTNMNNSSAKGTSILKQPISGPILTPERSEVLSPIKSTLPFM